MEQQMDTTDEVCFENLPVEIQQHIFSYCGTRTRREISSVCKDWSKKLEYFREDFQLYLHHCYLREDLDPVSLLMNSTRRYHSLHLGDEIHTASKEVHTRFFSYLGREVQVLDISSRDWMFLEENPDFLLFFPQINKLIVPKGDSLRFFKSFPQTLEHVHVELLDIGDRDEKIAHTIKSLKSLTSGDVTWRSTSAYTLEENLKVFLEAYSYGDQFSFKSNKNFLNASEITFDDVTESFDFDPCSLSSLNKFHNLRSISINADDLEWGPFCIDYHQAVIFAGVTELDIYINQQPCKECFESLIDSLPNVKKISLDTYDLTNQYVKYIFTKLPNLVHLETDSKHLNREIICLDEPQYLLGNLTKLESLILPKFVANNALFHWPFMPHLKKVEFGNLRDKRVLPYFTEKTPNLESFEIGDRCLLSDTAIEIIAKNWPKLRTLRLSYSPSLDLNPIKRFCRNLRILKLSGEFSSQIKSVHTYSSFFDAIPTLREMKVQDTTKYRYLKEIRGWD